MRSRLLVGSVAVLGALGFGATASATTPAPRLAPLPGAFDTEPPGGLFSSDGARYAVFSGGDGHPVILDSRTGRRAAPAVVPCRADASLPDSPNFFAPVGVGGGELISFCYTGYYSPFADQYLLGGLASPAVSRGPIRFNPFTFTDDGDLTAPTAVGSHWAYAVGGGYRPASPDSGYFNLATGAIVAPPAASPTTYVDLNSPALTRPLCAPVRTDRVPGVASAAVLGVERPWVLLGNADATGAPLWVWRCGDRRPRELGTVLRTAGAQLGSGVVSWVDAGAAINVESLSTRHRWRWRTLVPHAPAGGGYAAVVHTASSLYVVRQKREPTSVTPLWPRAPIYTASLRGL